MSGASSRFVFLLAVERADLVRVVEQALRDAEIAFETAIQAEPSPMVVFVVPEREVDRARVAVSQYLGVEPPPAIPETPEASIDEIAPPEAPPPARFPWGPFQAALALVLLHLAVLFTLVGRDPNAARLVAAGGLVRSASTFEPWRLFTSLVVHADIEHVAWNALALVVFAVPVIGWLGLARTGAVYLLAGVVGGSISLVTNPLGVVTVGSSGAVAGLFGAWLALTVRRARKAPMSRRALLRAIGIGMLVLPSLVNPVTDAGRAVAIEAHLGGAVTGLVLGAAASARDETTSP